MSFEYGTVERDLKEHFRTYWEARVPYVPLAWDNDLPLKPDPSETPKTSEWVEGYIVFTASSLAAIGGRESRVRGRMLFKIFTPRNRGTGRATSYVDTIADIWDSARTNGLNPIINLEATVHLPSGNDPNLPSRMGLAETPFFFMHFPS